MPAAVVLPVGQTGDRRSPSVGNHPHVPGIGPRNAGRSLPCGSPVGSVPERLLAEEQADVEADTSKLVPGAGVEDCASPKMRLPSASPTSSRPLTCGVRLLGSAPLIRRVG